MTTYNTCGILKRCGVNEEQHQIVRNLFGWSRTCEQSPSVSVDTCPSRACNEKPKRRSLLKWLFSSKKEEPSKKSGPKPDIRCCRRKWNMEERKIDPDFSEFGGEAYKTCGIAYVIQRDRLPVRIKCESRETRLLRIIETHPDLQKHIQIEPLKETENICCRHLEMSDRGLHPLYNKLAATAPSDFISKCANRNKLNIRPYRKIGPPMDIADVPAQVKINRKVLEKKNLYWCHKRVKPPSQLIGRLIEAKRSLTICHKKKTTHDDKSYIRRDNVYDSLLQKHPRFFQLIKKNPIHIDY